MLPEPRGRWERNHLVVTRKAVLASLTLVALLAAPPAEAAAPRLLMFDGKPLSRPAVLSDWPENLRLVTLWVDGPRAARAELRARPSLRVSLFWGPRWNDYVASGARSGR